MQEEIKQNKRIMKHANYINPNRQVSMKYVRFTMFL